MPPDLLKYLTNSASIYWRHSVYIFTIADIQILLQLQLQLLLVLLQIPLEFNKDLAFLTSVTTSLYVTVCCGNVLSQTVCPLLRLISGNRVTVTRIKRLVQTSSFCRQVSHRILAVVGIRVWGGGDK